MKIPICTECEGDWLMCPCDTDWPGYTEVADNMRLPEVPATPPEDFVPVGAIDMPSRGGATTATSARTAPKQSIHESMELSGGHGNSIHAPDTIRDRSNTPADDVLPNDARARKAVPAAAPLDYFDSAWVEIARALQDGNDQHNPGEALHWARGKSADHAHCIIRHFLQRGKLSVSPTGAVIRHSTSLAIRALMLLQEELEAAGAPLSRGSRLPQETK